MRAIIQLDHEGKLPIVAIAVTPMHKMPRIGPEELNTTSDVGRIGRLEDTVDNVKNIIDKVLMENISLRADISQYCAPAYVKVTRESLKSKPPPKSDVSKPPASISQEDDMDNNNIVKFPIHTKLN